MENGTAPSGRPNCPAWRYQHAGGYLRLCRWAFAETRAGRTIALSSADAYMGWTYTAETWRRAFWKALDRRINLKAGPEPAWRKLDDRYQTELERDCRAIREHATHHRAVHQLATPELRRRFGHIISGWED